MTDASFSLFPPRIDDHDQPAGPVEPAFVPLDRPAGVPPHSFVPESPVAAQPVYQNAPPPVSSEVLSHMPSPGLSAPPIPIPPVQQHPVGQAAINGVQSAPTASHTLVSTPVTPPASVARIDGDAELLACLQYVVDQGASDLHLSVNTHPRMRLHGSLADVPFGTAWTADKMSHALRSVMTQKQQDQFRDTQELDFALTLSHDSRFRVNVYQQRGFMGAAFRLIPTEIKSISDLGVPKVVERFASLPRGLVLVTGPTGSGKSTTLAALIDVVNRTRADHIVTVEDPIEFIHENRRSLVNQREVGQDTHSFTAALKHVLRQDPDVILIGELRDLETISTALTAAETGHLVFATLHTQSAAQTVDRIIDVFPPHQQSQVRAQLASTLQGVVCQTLVPRAIGGGRVAATEILVINSAIANLIREGKTFQIPSALQGGRELGMHTLDQHLAELVNHGIITHQRAMERAQDLESLNQLIHRSQSMRDVRATGGF